MLFFSSIQAQINLPRPSTNLRCMSGRQVALTDIEVRWGAPGVKGREGKIWGTDIANYGFMVLGFGSDSESPWRAGADECTTMSFSTDVAINGKSLAAGKYAFFIALYPDSSILIFSKNVEEWGSYFYRPEMDVLRVTTRQQKNQPQSIERLQYVFSDQTDSTVTVALEWERWRIPFTVGIDVKQTTISYLRSKLSSGLGFDPPSLQTAAQWCLTNNVNTDEALRWINVAMDPTLGGVQSFSALSTKAGLLLKKNNTSEADKMMEKALDNATVLEMHGYGRQLINQKKYKEALVVFEKNFTKHGDTWPVHVGLARGYSGVGDLKKALEHAKKAQNQAPDEINKRSLDGMIKTLSEGKALAQ